MEPAIHLLPARGPSFLDRLWQMLKTEVDAIWDGISVTYPKPTASSSSEHAGSTSSSEDSDFEVDQVRRTGTSLLDKARNQFFLEGYKLPSALTWLKPEAAKLRLEREAAAAVLPQNVNTSSFFTTSLDHICRAFALYDSEVAGSIPIGHTWWVPYDRKWNVKLQTAEDRRAVRRDAFKNSDILATNKPIGICVIDLKCELGANGALNSVVSYEHSIRSMSWSGEILNVDAHDAETLSWRRRDDGVFTGFSIIGRKAKLRILSSGKIRGEFKDGGLDDDGIILQEPLEQKMYAENTVQFVVDGMLSNTM
jgi:hypothetical protein